MNLFAQAQLNLVEAWNMSWEEGIQFIIVLVVLYYAKKRMDLYIAKKQAKTTIYKVKLTSKSILLHQ